MREVYLDNCATTRTDPDIAAAALEAMITDYGNPSSLHRKGLEAQLLLERAREQIATVLSCQPEEVYFTRGGTEANNLAILGAYSAHRRRATHLVAGQGEHASVLGPLKHLGEQGAEVALTPLLAEGHPDPQEMSAAVGEGTLLISCALVNSEVGGLAPIGEFARTAKAKSGRVLIHCDAVQAFGKIPISVDKLGVDMLSLSGHKLHAPKGIGALYIRKGVRIHPLMHGGQQQRGLCPGTESVPLAVAFGAAIEKITCDINRNFENYQRLRKFFLKKIENFPGLCINLASETTPYICSTSLPGYKSETLVHFLAERGMYVSGGSACAKGKDSHVLTAMGLPRERIQSALRVSFCKDTTEQDIDLFFQTLAQAAACIARSRA
ncbi:MAG: cysteine desulfurase [Oscillospiraceae bacterium]|nr:cysteine desulfurase [Oscillospiraceae bacterium]